MKIINSLIFNPHDKMGILQMKLYTQYTEYINYKGVILYVFLRTNQRI